VRQSTERTLTTRKILTSAGYVLLGALMIIAHRHSSPDEMAFDILMGAAWVVLGLAWFWKRERLPSENQK
jgi:hypothetical protein